jgi:carbamoyltransferase
VSFCGSIPVWIREKIFMKDVLRKNLLVFGKRRVPLNFSEHHLSHAASAFFASPFNEAAILTIDGVGEWATTTIGKGMSNSLSIIKELHFPHSLGLLYSAFTYYTGFKVNSGEYKLMGLAPYGDSDAPQTKHFKQIILNELIDLRDDGSFLLNMRYFNFATGLTMTHNKRWQLLFGVGRRSSESRLTSDYMNMALAIQQVTEEIVLRLARTARELTKCEYLTMAGGVALNCVANGRLLREGIFRDIWIQPAAGDAGGALGAALAQWHIGFGKPRDTKSNGDMMRGAQLGPACAEREIELVINTKKAVARKVTDFSELCSTVAGLLADGKIVGWVQGRMEFGPRALGNRSILGDPRNPQMQKKMNLQIKYRESFRPFAPAIMEEEVANVFAIDRQSPYMLFVAPLVEALRISVTQPDTAGDLFDRLYHKRSSLPAITHVDYSARVQTVSRDVNGRFWDLLNVFRNLTGCATLINTSFNVRGEPIVCTPEDAYRCFMRSDIDFLVIDNYLFDKSDQPVSLADSDWKNEFALD